MPVTRVGANMVHVPFQRGKDSDATLFTGFDMFNQGVGVGPPLPEKRTKVPVTRKLVARNLES